MSPVPGRLLVSPGVVPDPAKELTYTGEGPAQFSGSRICDMNAVPIEKWISPSGIDASYRYNLRGSGLYKFEFYVQQPDYTNSGGGFGHGWSGTYSGGSAWIRTIRGGATLEDNIAIQTIAGGATAALNQFHCGPVNRNLLAGDQVEFWTSTVGATGVGVTNWNAVALITKLRG